MFSEYKILANNVEYIIKLLSCDDEVCVQDLCERCSDFSLLVEGRLPEKDAGHDILFDLPPNKDLKDKFVLGVYKNSDALIAVIDLIKDFKVQGEWTLGLMMIDPSERGKGLGKRLHECIKTMVSESKCKTLRIGVVEENYKAYEFWKGMGYIEVDRVRAKYGCKEHAVIVMNLCLA
jgi:GNAT superfamily N-acetyltransferase